MMWMTLHDRPKNKHSAHIFRRFGLCLTTKYFLDNHVFKAMEDHEPGSLSPMVSRFTIDRNISIALLVGITLEAGRRIDE